ncbi:MAG: transporter ATP-binding protein [Verrucomicrobiales bacterium]|nr:transporter ATP-binding protein [Verrucomicrobiales bacterium]
MESRTDITVSARNVGLDYNRIHQQAITVLRNITFDVKRAEFVVILGPSGCGKTTLLKTICGLISVTEGELIVDGEPPDIAKSRHKAVMSFQDACLLRWRTVLENVRLPEELGDQRTGNAAAMLELVGLSAFANAYPDELSGGMKQRVALARALNCQPTILAMDEPFGQLDEPGRATLNDELLRAWKNTQVTVVFVTHSVPEAVYLADRIIVLTQRPSTIGRVIDVPFARPRNAFLRSDPQFFALCNTISAILSSPAA